ncbi:cbb3-type cytochrome c oxidase subunit II, partial [Roseateles sp. GG27B]
VGGAVEIVPLFFQRSTTEATPGLKPYTPLQLAGRDIYIREGCYNCHSQMIRPFRSETLRYGHYSTAGEFVY